MNPTAPAIEGVDLISCEACGVKDAPFHKPLCSALTPKRAVTPSARVVEPPMACQSCGAKGHSLYQIAEFIPTKNPSARIKRRVKMSVCASCYYWRYDWDERKKPISLEAARHA